MQLQNPLCTVNCVLHMDILTLDFKHGAHLYCYMHIQSCMQFEEDLSEAFTVLSP